MLSITHRLGSDHRRLLQIMSRLDRELQGNQRATWYSPARVGRILSLLDYIQGYPQRWHHPVEELAYRQLLAMDAPHSLALERLLDDHGSLEAQTDELFDRYEQCLNSATAPDAALLTGTYQYLNHQINHQKRENDTAFPLLDRLLGPQDWERIEQQVRTQPEALRSHHHYVAVYDRIVNRESPGPR